MKKILLIGLLAVAMASTASAVNVLTNGDWSTGDETGWSRWGSGRPVESYAITNNGPTPPEGTLDGYNGGQGAASYGWYQVVAVPADEVVTVDADWKGSNVGWAEVMLMSSANAAEDWGHRADVGNASDIAYKRDAYGTYSPTWDWQLASLSPLSGGNGGTIASQGYVCVALKLGNPGGSGPYLSFDNITLTPEPAAALLLGLPLLLIRRRRA